MNFISSLANQGKAGKVSSEISFHLDLCQVRENQTHKLRCCFSRLVVRCVCMHKCVLLFSSLPENQFNWFNFSSGSYIRIRIEDVTVTGLNSNQFYRERKLLLMSLLNVNEWTVQQVVEWIEGKVYFANHPSKSLTLEF